MNKRRTHGQFYRLAVGAFAVCMTLVAMLSGRGTGAWGAGEPDTVSQRVLGEITCDGPVSYRMSVGPWLRQSEGTYPVVMPLQARTAESYCRIVIGSNSLVELGPKTEVDLSQTEGGPLTVTIKKGAFLYAVPDHTALGIAVPPVGVVALAGSREPASLETTAPRSVLAAGSRMTRVSIGPDAFAGSDRPASVFSSVAHVGIVEMVEGPALKFYNLKGNLVYQEDDVFRAVAVEGSSGLVSYSSTASEGARSPAATAENPDKGKFYYVATDGDNATGDGSKSRPWATITHALGSVVDGSTITVRSGTYTGQVQLRGSFTKGVLVRSDVPYLARLRHDGTVVTCFDGRGITLEGFDIAHSGPGSGPRVIHIQDRRRKPGSTDFTSITLRNNVLHDSYDKDILTIDNGARRIAVEGNVFYNQSGPHAHIDVNGATDVFVQDNIFFNDFAGSGRTNGNDTGSYLVIRGSNADLASRQIFVLCNIFLNWEGSPDSYFVQIGKDGKPYHEARDVLVENNLMLGNASNVMYAPLGIKGARDVTFRHNTVVGDMPSRAFAMHLCTVGKNPPNENIRFYNNIWSDPTGTMGAKGPSLPNDFSDTPPGQTLSFTTDHNAYWNDREDIPYDKADLVNPTDDATSTVGNPILGKQKKLVPPRWDSAAGRFADRSATIGKAFERLVRYYGAPAKWGRPVVDLADSDYTPDEDILGTVRIDGISDIGCYEQSRLILFWTVPAGVLYVGRLDKHKKPKKKRKPMSPWRP